MGLLHDRIRTHVRGHGKMWVEQTGSFETKSAQGGQRMDIEIKKGSLGMVMKVLTDSPVPQQMNFPAEQYADLEVSYMGSSPYHVTYCGYEQVEPGVQFGPFARTSYLFHVVIKGKGVFEANGKEHRIHAGQVFLIRPHTETTYRSDEKDPWAYGWIGCTGYRLDRTLEQMGFTEDHPVLDVANASELFQRILNMMNMHKISMSNEMYRTSELLRFFGLVMENRENEHPEMRTYSSDAYAQVAMKYLNANYMKKIRISDLANIIGIERSYLTHIFCEAYQKSPQQYLMQIRMEKARELLLNTELRVSEIAARVGYPDALAFSRTFKKEHGKSPSEYKKYYSSSDQMKEEMQKKVQ